jgi:hypothetical protein
LPGGRGKRKRKQKSEIKNFVIKRDLSAVES